VGVKACGINFADVAVRLGLYKAAKGAYPLCPGLEFSGVVKKAGTGVSGFSPGDRVFGATLFGAYTTVVNCPSEHVWAMPSAWDFPKAATFVVVYLTAYYALHQVGHLRETDRVLVHSAAGGVGTAVLHLLKGRCQFSVGVVGRPEKVAPAKEAGATEVIDKSSQELWFRAREISPEGYDLILDANGASTLRGSYRHLRAGGRLLVYGFASMFSPHGHKNPFKLLWYYFRTPRFNPFALAGDNRTVSGFNLIYLFDRVELFRRIMDTLLKMERQGDFPAMPITAFPFAQVAKAHQALESGRSVGKLALVI